MALPHFLGSRLRPEQRPRQRQKGADLCAAEPKRVARLLADKGLACYDYTLQALQEIPYGRWRDYDIEDTVRFYALRMGELGLIKSTRKKSSMAALTGGFSET